MTDRLYSDPDLVQFYDIENKGGDDFNYCVGFAGNAHSILDLGCGTGQLAAALSEGRSVTGVDPASAMLDVARGRAGGDKVDWVEADARTVRLGRHFDLILLTGHAFQVFLTAEDQAAVLRTIANHLAPGGRFIFDTRNPAMEEWREWTPQRSERMVTHLSLGAVKTWNDVEHDAATGVVTYSTFYEIPGGRQVLAAESKIAFPDKDDLAAMLDESGLLVEQWLGDWRGEPYVSTSPEIIPIGRLR
ncbi:class I SAM-dependent methyltransferase [Mesorhizobium sp. BR1-1-9]|uniref:class I SAM-dependent methyltransferase n=1 Tax=unclassified Mesorhizobium TaxID=325217 RepID=UPI001126EC6A|nr:MULTISPECIES: class I SAM-dependent methyltransferase [unclassified Mesorhizobium]MBZ9806383.1 class I SAM-dependent methyltransferase [Mesorhizobium sp. ESP-6-2]MBZ9870869.1 class I SAM-dependent methyltransferase [Mesorhizobium sp. BR1-1-9]MBZ9939575.1 class I SAM-dependent methyltransferase [Mesorhizobium sp. BR1-1-13]TPM27404.1 class I SAM-dependent methyltransferase [Mesorhizobium sp. B2-2-2]